jgi:hypothetical protein
VRLIPAQFVRPFVMSNKYDYRDAEAIAEGVKRENMRFVPIKTEDQLDLQALHRVRDRLVARRTSVINQIRAFLLERGISFRIRGRIHFRRLFSSTPILVAVRRRTIHTYAIQEKDIRRFILEHPTEIDLRKIDQLWFLDLITKGLVRSA